LIKRVILDTKAFSIVEGYDDPQLERTLVENLDLQHSGFELKWAIHVVLQLGAAAHGVKL
jgi:hypothetical protein